MTTCRIYLCTYRRNHLLPRALNSLLVQTFTDWICELHNDDPNDSFPRELVEKTSDPRVVIVDHSENLGAVHTFNLVFQEVEESFVSLLEDDNWWEPDFLKVMIETMNAFPQVNVAWANMRYWQEEEDGTWTDTKKNIWDNYQNNSPQLIYWPMFQQIRGAVHSNGAMIVRAKDASKYIIPNNIVFGGTEAIRERAYNFPILFLPQRLANFAVTKNTARSKKGYDFAQKQILLTGSFFKHVNVTEDTLCQVFSHARKKPRSTVTLLLVALIFPECRKLLKQVSIGDWFFFIASCLKRPLKFWCLIRSVKLNKELWNFLDHHTAIRVQEAKASGFKAMSKINCDHLQIKWLKF